MFVVCASARDVRFCVCVMCLPVVLRDASFLAQCNLLHCARVEIISRPHIDREQTARIRTLCLLHTADLCVVSFVARDGRGTQSSMQAHTNNHLFIGERARATSLSLISTS